jgi:hypothetical protein
MGEGATSGESKGSSKEIPKNWRKDINPKIVQPWQVSPVLQASQSQPADIRHFTFRR